MAKAYVGQNVVYVDGEGKEKAATVLVTRKSFSTSGVGVAQPDKGHATLLITAPTGKTYLRENVPALAALDYTPSGRYFKPVGPDEDVEF